MKRVVTGVFILMSAVLLFLFWLVFLSPRPPLTTDPATLAGDGSTIDYCRLPPLNGSGTLAVDIPKGNTPGCGYTHFSLPVLAQCTEPLPAADREYCMRSSASMIWEGKVLNFHVFG